MTKKAFFFVLFILILSGCSSARNYPLTKDQAAKLVAQNYNVSIDDIQVTNFTSVKDGASVSYKIKRNNLWEPEGNGWYMAQAIKDKTGTYKVTVIKFNDTNK
jgi:uncharacterized protein YcfL